MINPEVLSALLPKGVSAEVFDSLPSTSTFLREKASSGAPELTLVAAQSQTAGKGRFGRAFFSPPDTGVYFSLLLRPAPEEDTAALITAAAALACAETCRAVFGVYAEIKWVNDVLVRGKKVVGILAEAFSDRGFYVILGIGTNLVPPPGGFPEISGSAGAVTSSLEGIENASERYIAGTVTRFLEYLHADKRDIVSRYVARTNMDGRTVTVTRGTERYVATVLGIDEKLRLVVRRTDGTEERLSYGEVTLHNEH